MKTLKPVLFFLFVAFLAVSCQQKRQGPPRALVFYKTAAFHHASIPSGVEALKKMGKEKGFEVTATDDATYFTEDSLKQYAVVIFLNTTGDVLNFAQQADFERYIQAGGGYVGIHAASDTEYDWPWYGQLVGAYFKAHPKIQEAKLKVHKDSRFPVTDSLPDPWVRTDEWYNFKEIPANVNVLVSIDESSYEGGSNGKDHPMVWYHDYDGGRAFYMELGHTDESYKEPAYLELLWEGIDYAMGGNKVLDYNKAVSLRKPDEDRFSRVRLSKEGSLDEPTELTVLPDLSVLITERKGQILYYNSKDSSLKQVAEIPVYDKALHVKNVNVETGLLGIHADPDYANNHWVYIYYSPVDTSVDRLSRFKFEDGQFKKETEQVILNVKTDREICCHTGGSIAFDGEGNLYVSVGDNTTPFDETDPKTGKKYPFNQHGFAPIDDRPGFENFDDRRAAANTNDLRGSILRIHVNEDGSYNIPKGNLFPVGTDSTRPEIYVMGGRNLYRLSVDKHTGYVYWGDVGPDARNDSLATRGPKGYDEVNQARKPGFFGWPMFRGNNIPYIRYNFATGVSGKPFDAEHPINDSRNNTGLRHLPPAQEAFIWYPYDASKEFPILGTGGRTAMAGPVYYVDDYPAATAFPGYYDKKLFIYDWIRNWIMAVTMDKEGNLETIEPFMEHTKFAGIIDMEAGPDGKLYIIEYGTGKWFGQNNNSGLSVLTYNGGNRAPVARIKVDKTSGALPLEIMASAEESSDPDGDPLKYIWHFGEGKKVETDKPTVNYTYEHPGSFPVSVTVEDSHGAKSTSTVNKVFAGNSEPQVDIQIESGNPMFYFPNGRVGYKVNINDAEDGSSSSAEFDKSRAFVEASYLDNFEKASEAQNSPVLLNANLAGKSLMETLDCQACHQINQKSVGPSFEEVAQRYQGKTDIVGYLTEKIIKGGSGNWGERAMSAHPDLSEEDAGQIVRWILSLGDKEKQQSMPLEGSFVPASRFKLTPNGVVVLSASYTDKGAENVAPLTGVKNVILRNPVLSVASTDNSEDISSGEMGNVKFKLMAGKDGWIKWPGLNLKGVKKIRINYGVENEVKDGWKAELHSDKPDGQVLGSAILGEGLTAQKPANQAISLLGEMDGTHDLYLIIHKNDPAQEGSLAIIGLQLEN